MRLMIDEPIRSSQFKDTIYRMYHLRMAKRESAKMGHRIKKPITCVLL